MEMASSKVFANSSFFDLDGVDARLPLRLGAVK